MPETQPTTPVESTETATPTLLNQTSTEPIAAPTTTTEPGTEPTKPAESAPEKYEFAPPKEWAEKGWEFDPGVLERATPILKELGLTQAQASRLMDFYAAESSKDHEASIALARQMTEGWLQESMNHPDLRGKLGTVDAPGPVRKAYNAMLTALPSDLASDFKSAMDLTGVGNHPAFIRAIAKWGARFEEGTPVQGKGPSPHGQVANGRATPPSAAAAIYPTLPSRG